LQKLYIYHEKGSTSHIRALEWGINKNSNYKIIFRGFEFSRNILRSFYYRDLVLLKKQILDLLFLFALPFIKNKKIIVGITPYNWKIIFLYPLIKRNTNYFFSSWPVWGYKKHPKKFLANSTISKRAWAKFINNAAGIFCVTKKVAEEISYYYRNQKLSVVYHAIPVSYVKDKFYKNQNKKINCLFVGRYDISKGIQLILKIIHELNEKEFNFYFIGNGILNKEINDICAMKGNCYNLGFLFGGKLQEMYEKCDILLAPSLRTNNWEELFGMVIIEAMACGCIPFVTDHTGPSEIVEHNKTGFIYKEEEFISKGILHLDYLSNNRNALCELQEKAFKKGQEFSPKILFERWNSLLKIN